MATTLLCPGSPRSGPQLRHEQRPGAPSGCAPALREWLDGVSDALCMLPPQLRDYRPFATTATRSRLHLPGTTGLRVRSPWPAAGEEVFGTEECTHPRVGSDDRTALLERSLEFRGTTERVRSVSLGSGWYHRPEVPVARPTCAPSCCSSSAGSSPPSALGHRSSSKCSGYVQDTCKKLSQAL